MMTLYAFTEADIPEGVGELTPGELSALKKSLEGVHQYVSEVAEAALIDIVGDY